MRRIRITVRKNRFIVTDKITRQMNTLLADHWEDQVVYLVELQLQTAWLNFTWYQSTQDNWSPLPPNTTLDNGLFRRIANPQRRLKDNKYSIWYQVNHTQQSNKYNKEQFNFVLNSIEYDIKFYHTQKSNK